MRVRYKKQETRSKTKGADSPHWLKSSRPACALEGLGPGKTDRNLYNRQIYANRTDILIFVE